MEAWRVKRVSGLLVQQGLASLPCRLHWSEGHRLQVRVQGVGSTSGARTQSNPVKFASCVLLTACIDGDAIHSVFGMTQALVAHSEAQRLVVQRACSMAHR